MLLFLSRLVRVLFALLVVRLLLRAVAGWLRAPRPVAPKPSRPRELAADLVRDNFCNTFLPRNGAIKALVAGREEYFCSNACRDRALAAMAQAS